MLVSCRAIAMNTRPRFKIEVGPTKSSGFSWWLRLAKKQSGYRLLKEDGMEVHVIETAELDTFAALWKIASRWQNVALYLDGRLINTDRITRLIWAMEWKPEKTKQMLREIIEEHHRKLDGGQDRMGM